MIAYLESSPVLRFMVGAASLVILVLGMHAAAGLLAPILFALFLAILLNPLMDRMRHRGIPNGAALLIVGLAVVIAGLALLALLYSSLSRLVIQLPYYQELLAARLAPAVAWLNSKGIDATDLSGLITGADATRALIGLGLGLISTITSSLFLVFLFLFLLADGPGFVARSHRLWARNLVVSETMARFSHGIQTQIRLTATNNLMAAVAVTIGLWALGIDFALLWGVLSFILAFIPNVGIVIATIPAVLLAFIQYGLQSALLVAGLVLVVNLAMDNLITPRMAGRGLNLSPAVVFLSFVFWTWVFGPLGALLAVPLTVLVVTVAREIKSTRWLAVLASAKVVDADLGSDQVQPEAEKEPTGDTGEMPSERDRAA